MFVPARDFPRTRFVRMRVWAILYDREMSSWSFSSCLDSSDQNSDTDTNGSSDLDDLYQSFDFEDEAALDSVEATSTALSDISKRALYPGAQISSLQSYLQLFQFSIRHSLTTKSFTELLQLLFQHLLRFLHLCTN